MIHGKYIEVENIISEYLPKGIHIYYVCAGRGLGKTYSSLDLCRKLGEGILEFDVGYENKFLYLRRTDVEAQSCASIATSPFKKYNRKEGYDISASYNSSLGIGNIYKTSELKENDHIGYIAGLSTFSNLRGIDFSDVTFILYDECIPQSKNYYKLQDEGFLLLDMLETINRNRALEDHKEVVFLMLSNPIDLSSPFLSQLQITPILNDMIFNNQQRYTSYDRSLHIEKLKDHDVSKEKAEKSMLYKFAKGTGYNERSLTGDFVNNDLSKIRKKVNLAEYKPLYNVENLTVFKHKVEEIYYISQKYVPAKLQFKVYQKELLRTAFYWEYKLLIIYNKVFYDNFSTKTVFDEMIKYKAI